MPLPTFPTAISGTVRVTLLALGWSPGCKPPRKTQVPLKRKLLSGHVIPDNLRATLVKVGPKELRRWVLANVARKKISMLTQVQATNSASCLLALYRKSQSTPWGWELLREKGSDLFEYKTAIYIHQEWEMLGIDSVNNALRTKFTGMCHRDREKVLPNV